MTIKLPIILSAMIAALAVPGTLASQAGTEPAKPEAAAPTAEAKDAKKEGGTHKKRKKHHHHAHHGESNSPTDPYKKSFDEGGYELPKADGSPDDHSPKAGPMVHPGEKAPS